MKAIAITEFGGIEKLHLTDVPTPKPHDNEVLIKIQCTAVNPVDWKICEGKLTKLLPHEFPIILGWDAAGTIAAVGRDVTQFKLNDEVFAYCRKPVIQNGTYAEYIALDANHVALKPPKLSFAQAAAVPLVALTAWQALTDHAQLKAGESVLIHAGAGGVGSFAIGIAKELGAKVYTTASGSNHAYVKQLGADTAIDYHKENIVEKARSLEPKGFDVILDCVGGQTLKDSYPMLKPQGRLVSIVELPDQKLAEQNHIKASFCFVAPNGKQLAHLADLISKGKIKLPQIEEMSLKDVAKAHEKVKSGHTRGKIVLNVH